MPIITPEARIILAIEAKRTNPKLSIRYLAIQYDVPRTTIQNRMIGKIFRPDSRSGIRILTVSEKNAIIEYILQLDSKGFSSRKVDVEDMANLLVAKRDALPIGKNWTDRFIA